MHIAITTDWLVAEGGAEQVLRECCALFPQAPLFTTVHHPSCLQDAEDRIRTTSLQPLFRLLGTHRPLLPLMPRAVEWWDLRGYDVILSSSHAVGKGCLPMQGAAHICYCHTPMRYAWEMEEEYLEGFRLQWPTRTIARRILRHLRLWDYATSKRVDQFIANSQAVAERIRRLYDRESVVIPPPVREVFFRDTVTKEELPIEESLMDAPFFLAVGRFVPYKRFDLLIHAANAQGIPLILVGEGPEEAYLRKIAGPTIRFAGRVPDTKLRALYTTATALLFPVHEDAGIVPMEAMACGTPIIALGKGGILDTVIEGKTGLFFDAQTEESLLHAIMQFRQMHLEREEIRKHAEQFSAKNFRQKISEVVKEVYERRRSHLTSLARCV